MGFGMSFTTWVDERIALAIPQISKAVAEQVSAELQEHIDKSIDHITLDTEGIAQQVINGLKSLLPTFPNFGNIFGR
jgi:Ca2+-dependent lipid-binding protein